MPRVLYCPLLNCTMLYCIVLCCTVQVPSVSQSQPPGLGQGPPPMRQPGGQETLQHLQPQPEVPPPGPGGHRSGGWPHRGGGGPEACRVAGLQHVRGADVVENI